MKQTFQAFPTFFLVLICLLLVAAPSSAQEPGFTLGLMAGIGGSVDEETDYSNTAWQALFSYDLQPRQTFTVRAGQLDIDGEDAVLGLRDSTLSYVTLGGDFHFPESFYRGGLFVGLGYYDLDSDFVGGDSAAGLTLGTTADFKINPKLSILLEFAGHFADLDAAQFFVTAHTGVAWRF